MKLKLVTSTQARRHWQSQPAGEVRQLLAAGMLMAARGEPSDLLRSLSLEARRAPLRASGPSFPGGGLCCKLAPTRVESLNLRRRAAMPHHSAWLHVTQSHAACPSVERGGPLADDAGSQGVHVNFRVSPDEEHLGPSWSLEANPCACRSRRTRTREV